MRFAETNRSSKGEIKLVIDGYVFNKNRVKTTGIYWQCEEFRKKGCKGRAVMTMVGNRYRIENSSEHSHNTDPTRMLNEVLNRNFETLV